MIFDPQLIPKATLNYIDPGTAAMIIQIVIASAGGSIIVFRSRISLFFKSILDRIKRGKDK